MSLEKLHRKAMQEFKVRWHDRRIAPALLIAVVLFYVTPQNIILSVVNSFLFRQLVFCNPFATKMASYGGQGEYSLFCYGMSTLLMPYFIYILFKSKDLMDGVNSRYDSGGRSGLVVSAMFCLLIIITIYHLGDLTASHVTRVVFFIFYTKTGISLMSVGLSYLLALAGIYFIQCVIFFYKTQGDES